MQIVLAGASGFIGRPLIARFLGAGHTLVVLSRQDARTEPGGQIRRVKWDARSAGEWTRYLEDAEAVINLAGEPLTVWPWTLRQKQRLLESRVAATRALVNAMGSLPKRPRVFVNASAIGYYGSGGETVLDENSLAGKPYLAALCQAWEASASAARSLHIRVVCARLGLVLGGGGGVLKRLVPVFRYYLGGPLGSGKQWLSWIQLADAAAALEWLLTQEQIDGPVNLTSPEPVRMQEFCRVLGNLLHRHPPGCACPAGCCGWSWVIWRSCSKAVNGSIRLFCISTVFLSLIQPYPPRCPSRLTIWKETCRNHPA